MASRPPGGLLPRIRAVLPLLLSFFVAASITLLIVRSASMHGKHSGDRNFAKPQGFHAVAVPRIGGLGIVVGAAAAFVLLASDASNADRAFGVVLLLCGAPVFVAGFVQDLSESLSPRGRLVASALSAVIAFFVVEASVTQTGIPPLDWLAGFAFGSLIITIVAVAGIANSINIIDGFNGLASMCVMLMLGALAYVAFQVGDPTIGTLALVGIGAVLGFFIWNYPAGLIFLGDGGAYFLGFFVAELAILLVHRNPGQVSPLLPLLLCIYPVFETLFSIYRRTFLRALPPSVPDGIHLHSLIYRRMLRWAVGDRSARALTRRNSMTAPYLWVLCMLSLVPVVLFYGSTPAVGGFIVLFAVTYVVLYWRIVRFKSPRWLRPRAWWPGAAARLASRR
jgi:UDP-N-acetylmuramyl pentapeptide phosphotransferase/UDP-N-acetylglucosamine-1-phosphate transferase